jgi:hypothetical protein
MAIGVSGASKAVHTIVLVLVELPVTRADPCDAAFDVYMPCNDDKN